MNGFRKKIFPTQNIVAAFVWVSAGLLASCGGGAGDSSSGQLPIDPKALATAKTGELVGFYKSVLQKRIDQGLTAGQASPVYSPVALSAGGDTSSVAPRSSTNVQEAGVDEADLLKTDGNNLYALVRTASADSFVATNQLKAYARNGATGLTETASVGLIEGTASNGLYLSASGTRAVVTTATYKSTAQVVPNSLGITIAPPIGLPSATSIPYPGYSQTQVEFFNTSNRLEKIQRLNIDGTLVSSRLIGNILVLALTWYPQIAADYLPASAPLATRAGAIAALTAQEVLPTLSVDGGPAVALMNDTDCYLQNANASTDLTLTAIVTIDLASPTLARKARCIAGGTEAIYVTPQSIYLATTRWTLNRSNTGVAPTTAVAPDVMTDIHKFSIAGADVNYRGSGSVAGQLGWNRDLSSYRMSEFNGDLRVLTFTGGFGWLGAPSLVAPSGTASPATLSILRESTVAGKAELATLSTLPNSRRTAALGKPNEQVYAVRFDGSRAYVVTFLRTDPLYVLDLADPTDPKILGELNVTGFSDYLLPLSNNLLLGVGKEADLSGRVTGVKVTLYDVVTPSAPIEIANRVYGAAGSASALDGSPHGLNQLTVGDLSRLALPVRTITTNSNNQQTISQSLKRFEVDTQTRRFTELPELGLRVLDPLQNFQLWLNHDIYRERSLQIGGSAYYLGSGTLQGFAW